MILKYVPYVIGSTKIARHSINSWVYFTEDVAEAYSTRRGGGRQTGIKYGRRRRHSDSGLKDVPATGRLGNVLAVLVPNLKEKKKEAGDQQQQQHTHKKCLLLKISFTLPCLLARKGKTAFLRTHGSGPNLARSWGLMLKTTKTRPIVPSSS